MPNVELNCSAWYDERRIRLTFPDDWTLEVIGGPTLPALSSGALRAVIRNPVDGEPLSAQARRARTAAIIVDDMTRPTPLELLLPLLVEELAEAGIGREAVTVFVAGGTHGSASPEDIRRKLGAEMHAGLRVVAHDMRRSELRDLGRSSHGTPIRANAQMLDCDLKIGIGGLYPHPVAGFSGGSKLIAPGLCSFETAKNLHDSLGGDDWRGRAERNLFRSDVDEIAGRIGLSFVVNVALNFDRQIAGAFAGDRMAVQRAGVDFVRSAYSVPDRVDADIVISDGYPFDTDFTYAFDRASWPLASRKAGAAGVLLASCTMGAGGHELDRPLGERIVNRLRTIRPAEVRRLPQRLRNLRAFLARKHLGFLLLSDKLDRREIADKHPRVIVLRTWTDALMELHGSGQDRARKVALYRCAPLLVPRPPL